MHTKKCFWLLLVLALMVVSVAAQCGAAPAAPAAVETVIVTKEVEKQVQVTVEVQKEVMVTPTVVPGSEMPAEIVFMDDQSGANFQQWFQTIALPSAEEALGFKVKYVVGKDAETFERMKAWKEGEGDFAVLFPKSLAKLIGEKIALETLTPEKIPNMAKVQPNLQIKTEGVDINNLGVAYWDTTYALIYDSSKVKEPPKSWAEFYDRRAEFKGHIGMIRPDAKSSAGWRQPYAFLNAFYDFSKTPFDPKDPDFVKAWAKLKDFYTYATLPLAAEPSPNLFENINAGDTWISLYAMDYSLWSAHQGTLPPTIKAAFLKEGVDTPSSAYLVVPTNITEGQKQAAYKLINYLLSDDQQVRLVSTMWQYPSTQVKDKVPGIVWENIPTSDVAHASSIPVEKTNKDAIDYVKKNALELIPK
jgi:putative spermidine/putrescine transport system substrate-binding protein